MNQFSQFVESLKRLYDNQAINEEKIIELYNKNKITEKEKWYILTK